MIIVPKFNKGLTLAIAPFKTINITVTECDSFEDCDERLKKELGRMPVIKKLNEADIEKVFGNAKGKSKSK